MKYSNYCLSSFNIRYLVIVDFNSHLVRLTKLFRHIFITFI